MARRDPIGIRLLTRNGHDWAPRYPLIVEAVNRLKARSCLIDGDLRREPLETREAALASLLRGRLPGLRLNEHLAHDGESVFRHQSTASLIGCPTPRRSRTSSLA
jgi:ATP-dependent DNA ligase